MVDWYSLDLQLPLNSGGFITEKYYLSVNPQYKQSTNTINNVTFFASYRNIGVNLLNIQEVSTLGIDMKVLTNRGIYFNDEYLYNFNYKIFSTYSSSSKYMHLWRFNSYIIDILNYQIHLDQIPVFTAISGPPIQWSVTQINQACTQYTLPTTDFNYLYGNCYIGAEPTSINSYFQGNLSSVSVFNTALSDTERLIMEGI